MVAFTQILAVCWLLAGASAAAHERYAAMETGLVLSPQEYLVSPAHPLAKRQEGGCNPGHHPCNEIGPAGATACCENNQYCLINPTDTSKAGCCRLGSRCGSPCQQTEFQCNKTTTITTDGVTTTSLVDSCCSRACTGTSQYRCPTPFEGGCCSYNQKCGASSHCIFTPSPSTSALLTAAPPGCSTGQISCASSLGGGCCAASQTCTLINDKGHCAEVTLTPTDSGISVVPMETGLSTGAKAGIAVGVVVGAGLLIGVITWWIVRRRREIRRSEAASSAYAPRPDGVPGQVGGAAAAVGGGAGRGYTTDEASEIMSTGRGRGMTQDYFGGAPAMGPYSETHSTSAVTTPGLDRERGVPLQPHGPSDISVPVEIDSRLGSPQMPQQQVYSSTTTAGTPGVGGSHASDNGYEPYERYELYGSDAGQLSPSLPSPSDERHR